MLLKMNEMFCDPIVMCDLNWTLIDKVFDHNLRWGEYLDGRKSSGEVDLDCRL